MAFSVDIVLLVQIAVGAIVLPLLVSGLLYYFWPNWHYVASKFACMCYPCTALCKYCCRSNHDPRKRHRHEPHYMEPERASTGDPMRQSKTKADRRLRIENPKRREREMSMVEEEWAAAGDLQHMTRLKAQATRVEKKAHRPPADHNAATKTSAGFKYQFEEEKLSDEVNPFISSSSTTHHSLGTTSSSISSSLPDEVRGGTHTDSTHPDASSASSRNGDLESGNTDQLGGGEV